jgi:hypothetical protein
MHMIWHDYESIPPERFAKAGQACVNHNPAHGFRQNPSLAGREGDEECFVIGLVVG